MFVRAEDEDGVVGWGEVWANFPSTGAEHRARLVNEVLAPAVIGRALEGPAQAFEILTQGTAVLALQCGEPGPFAQAIAGIDLALWDLHARRHRQPLWRLLGGRTGKIRVYASGINPGGARQTAEAAMRRGHRALKLKIGFDMATDLANLAALRTVVGDGMLAADVNQGWSIDQALEIVPRLWRVWLALAGGAASCRSPPRGVAEAAHKRRHAACGRREYCEPRRLRTGSLRGRA